MSLSPVSCLTEGAAEVIDFMPLGGRDKTDKEHTIIRMVNGVRGHIRLNVECDPAFNYARDAHTVSISGRVGALQDVQYGNGPVVHRIA